MSKFKIGDRVKVICGGLVGEICTVVDVLTDGRIDLKVKSENHGVLHFFESELEPIEMPKFVEVKTKTVKKYAVVKVSNGGNYLMTTYYTEEQVAKMTKNQEKHIDECSYHIVPTLFTEEEVPVKTETRYAFIGKDGEYGYFVTSDKYKDLAEAKAATMTQALQQIDSSAEEFEIE